MSFRTLRGLLLLILFRLEGGTLNVLHSNDVFCRSFSLSLLYMLLLFLLYLYSTILCSACFNQIPSCHQANKFRIGK